jgi:midasin (ATPase involved in ribosome maturation)
VHQRFRLFATLNPAEYSGRSVLSPAFRDRWLVWHQAEVATEAEVSQMLRRLVFGEHPVVTVNGQR